MANHWLAAVNAKGHLVTRWAGVGIFSGWLLFAMSPVAVAEAPFPAAPPVSAPVIDDAHVLSSASIAALDAQLGEDNSSSVAQLAVATVATTGSTPIAGYAEQLFNR